MVVAMVVLSFPMLRDEWWCCWYRGSHMWPKVGPARTALLLPEKRKYRRDKAERSSMRNHGGKLENENIYEEELGRIIQEGVRNITSRSRDLVKLTH